MSKFFKYLVLCCIALPITTFYSCEHGKENENEPEDNKPMPGQEDEIKGIAVSYIPAGTFVMGSPDNEEGRYRDEVQHKVTLTEGFWMSRYEITSTEYVEFLNKLGIGKDGKYNTEAYGEQTLVQREKAFGMTWDSAAAKWKVADGRENCPAVSVSWFGAHEYAKWIGGSLPTEAQWEYACRAGSTTAFCYGDDPAMLDKYGWYDDNSGLDLHPVGGKQPNSWNLYDMHGNAWEWCSDWYGEYAGDVTDPQGPDGQIDERGRIMRSGSWFNCIAEECRSAYRIDTDPAFMSIACGFRIIFPEITE